MLNNTPSTESSTNVNVSITLGDVKVQFNGSPESVLASVINFMTKQVPTIDLARKISLNYAVTELIELFSNFIKKKKSIVNLGKILREIIFSKKTLFLLTMCCTCA